MDLPPDRPGGHDSVTATLGGVTPQHRGLLEPDDRARILAALKAREDADLALYDAVRTEFVTRGAFLVEGRDRDRLRQVISREGKLNAAIVGQSAATIARMAGFTVPEDTRILLAEAAEGQDRPDPAAHREDQRP